jgi:cobalt-zinc-cadmium efflux system membrane fusion protein
LILLLAIYSFYLNKSIILISKDVDANGITEVHCHFDNYDKSLIPGMYMNAELNIPSRKSNIISEDAVVSYEGKSYIFIAKNKLEYEMREVQTGNTADHEIEILNGHSFDGNEIVTKGAYTLLMKLKNTEEE